MRISRASGPNPVPVERGFRFWEQFVVGAHWNRTFGTSWYYVSRGPSEADCRRHPLFTRKIKQWLINRARTMRFSSLPFSNEFRRVTTFAMRTRFPREIAGTSSTLDPHRLWLIDVIHNNVTTLFVRPREHQLFGLRRRHVARNRYQRWRFPRKSREGQ